MTPAAFPVPPRPFLRRALLWGLLLALLAVAQTLLVLLTLRYEAGKAQDAAEAVAHEAATQVRRELMRLTHALQVVTWSGTGTDWPGAAEVLKQRPELRRIEWRDTGLAVVGAVDSPFAPPLFSELPRRELGSETEPACRAALREAGPSYSRSYYVPGSGGLGQEVVDLCLPVQRDGRLIGYLVGVVTLSNLLEAVAGADSVRRHELTFVEGDGARLARAGAQRGAGIYVAEHRVDLPGQSLQLRADGVAGRPSLIPNLTVALVLGLSIALFGLVFVLAGDVRRRAVAEQALREAFGFRRAMEDSLSTGLRARSMDGAITYVNPAFCAMVGYSAEELQAVRPPALPPYWPPERAADHARLQAGRATQPAAGSAREGVEALFVRKNGERFPVMIYEAPLLDGAGHQTGWMGAVLDLTAQRRIEDLARQQQERLQASSRLATVGEMASLLGHELNQPLAAIASYASGSLNLLAEPRGDAPPGELEPMLQQAFTRIAEQAERAGRVIKSVHDFARRRETLRESIAPELLLEAVLPLVRLQMRKSGARLEVDLPAPPARLPHVQCDRTLVEQVLLNLARNGIQAMETQTPPAERLLRIRLHLAAPGRVGFEVEDAGPGIAPEVAARLFTPFFTTRAEGMGLGLSLCRTVAEQHGGALDFGPGTQGRGTVFRFTLPAVPLRRGHAAPGAQAPEESRDRAHGVTRATEDLPHDGAAGPARDAAPDPSPGKPAAAPQQSRG